jgi:hypothetical protein
MVYTTLAYGHKGESMAVAMIIRITEEDFIGLTEST